MAGRLLKNKGVYEYLEASKIVKKRGLNIVDSNEPLISYKTFSILYPDNLGDKEHEFICYGVSKSPINPQ